jgi:hypothetical protein
MSLKPPTLKTIVATLAFALPLTTAAQDHSHLAGNDAKLGNGAAHSAKLADNAAAAARKYSAELLKVCAKADQPGRAELADARTMVGGIRADS